MIGDVDLVGQPGGGFAGGAGREGWPPGPAPGRLALAALLALLCQASVSIPFVARPDLLVRHFDGPNYLVVAKTLYQPTAVNPLPGYIYTPRYFAVHLPAYPLAVRALSWVAGYPAGLLLATALLGAVSSSAFTLYAADAAPLAHWLPLVIAFLLVPPRSLLYRSLGATEAPMALFVLLAVWALRRERTVLAFAFASLSSICRINGLLVIGVFVVELIRRRRYRTALLGGIASVVPLGLVFAWQDHLLGSGSFLAIHAGKKGLVPFAHIGELIERGEWPSAELLVLLFVVHALAAGRLFARGLRIEALLVTAHIGLFSLLRETDLSRYFVTVAPFTFVIAWEDVFRSWRRAGAVLALAASLGFPYAWRSIPQNACEPVVYEHLVRFLQAPLDPVPR